MCDYVLLEMKGHNTSDSSSTILATEPPKPSELKERKIGLISQMGLLRVWMAQPQLPLPTVSHDPNSEPELLQYFSYLFYFAH